MQKLPIRVIIIFAVISVGNCWKLALIKWPRIIRALTERWTEVLWPLNETSLNGKNLLVDTDLIYPYTIAYNVNDKLIISGFNGEIWSILEEWLNFTSDFTILARDFELNESNVTLILTNTYPSSVNFRRGTVPLTAIWFHLYTKRAPVGGGLLFYKSLSGSYLRDAILVMFITFSILDWIMKKTTRYISTVRKRKVQKNYIRFSESVINSLGLLCCQGTLSQPLSTSFRLFNLTQMVFTLIVSTAFSATLISKLAGASDLQLEMLSNLVSKGDYTLCSSKVGLASSIINDLRFQSIPHFPKEWMKNVNRPPCTNERLEFVPVTDYCQDKTVILEVFQVSNSQWNNKPGHCNILRHPTRLFSTLLSLNVAEDFRYLDILNRYLLKFKEYGIVKRIEQKWLPKDYIVYPVDEIGVSFVEIQSFIALLGGGIALSLLAFILEALFYCTVQGEATLLNAIGNKRRRKVKRVPPFVFVH